MELSDLKITYNGMLLSEESFLNITEYKELSKVLTDVWKKIEDQIKEGKISDKVKVLGDVLGEEFGAKFNKHWTDVVKENHRLKEVEEFKKPIEISGEKYLRSTSFAMYHLGWEGDSTGWVSTRMSDNQAVIILTNHGGLYVANPEELTSKIKELETNIEVLRDVLMSVSPR